MEGKSRRNGHGLVVWAIFATYPRATIDKSSASSGLVRVELDGAAETFLCLEFLLLADIPNWTKLCHTQLQDSFPRIMVLSKVSWDSASVFYLAVYDQPKAWGVSKTLEAKKTSPFFRECVFFGRMNETFTDWLEIGPEASKIPILKSVWGFSVFRNSSPAMVSDVTCIGKILITKLNRKIARQPIGISKKQHTDLKTKPLRLTLSRSFVCAVRFDTQLIRSTNHRPFRIVALESFYD